VPSGASCLAGNRYTANLVFCQMLGDLSVYTQSRVMGRGWLSTKCAAWVEGRAGSWALQLGVGVREASGSARQPYRSLTIAPMSRPQALC
jgi:hypothetical protein